MTIKTIIVDDEPLARELIRSLLSDEVGIEIIEECVNGRTALEAIRNLKPDLVLLDVRMPVMSGAAMLSKLDPESAPYIIFVTAYDQYAVNAFELKALDYILKPIEKSRFRNSIDRARVAIKEKKQLDITTKVFSIAKELLTIEKGQAGSGLRLGCSQLEKITIREGDKYYNVSVDDIIHLTAADQYVRIHTISHSHLLSESLASLERQLDPKTFVRIHRSTIVNISFVNEVRAAKNGAYRIVLSTGVSLKLSRGRNEELQQLLNRPI